MVCQEMDPESKPFYLFQFIYSLKRKQYQNVTSQNLDDKCRFFPTINIKLYMTLEKI